MLGRSKSASSLFTTLTLLFLASCATGQRGGSLSPPPAVRRPTPAENQSNTSAAQLRPSEGSYRSVYDSPEWGRAYQNARRLYDRGRKQEGLAQIRNYYVNRPDGQFADEAAFLLGKQAFETGDQESAFRYFERVATMDPPSRLRGDALYFEALALVNLNRKKEALDNALAKIDVREVTPTQRHRIFLLWGRTAADEGRWLESCLAYVKARKEIPDAASQKDLEALVEDEIENRLSESELNFMLQEYSSDFPSALVQIRLVTLKLAAGKRSEALSLLQGIVAGTLPGTRVHTRATQMLGRLQNLTDASPNRIGALLPLSGHQENLGHAVQDGLQLAFGERGEGGPGLELVPADVGATPESAVKAFERLVFEDKVIAVVGPIAGPQAESVAVRASELGIPNITLSPRPGLLEKGPFIFRSALTPERQVRALVAYATERLNAHRFAILFSQDNFGKEFAQEYFKAVHDFGGEVTAAESYAPEQSDFRVQVENMTGTAFPNFRRTEAMELQKSAYEKTGRTLTNKEMNAARPAPIVDFDVIFIPDTFKAVGQIVPALIYADVQAQLMGPSTWNNSKILNRAGQYMDKALFVDSFAPDRQSRVTKDFVERFTTKKGSAPSAPSATGYDVGLALRLAFAQGGPTSRDELRSKLEALGSFDGAQGVYVWDAHRDTLSEIQLFEILKGSFRHQGGISLKPKSN